MHSTQKFNPQNFLQENNITEDDLAQAEISKIELIEIGNDFELKKPELQTSAEYFSNILQKIKHVHSVRMRIKDTTHLLEKIIRKRKEKSEKYMDINKENYQEKITDLIGLRAIHLFKNDFITIDREIQDTWEIAEKPTIYIRSGDLEILGINNDQFETKEHPFGYRSIHYIINSSPLKRKITAEIQVRTIFEEGWSEIDHNVRYPNFSQNELVKAFLTLFNRLAGSADEMGSFAKDLASRIDSLSSELEKTDREKTKAFEKIEATINQIQKLESRDRNSAAVIDRLKHEIKSLKTKLHSHSPGIDTNTTILDKIQKELLLNSLNGIISGKTTSK